MFGEVFLECLLCIVDQQESVEVGTDRDGKGELEVAVLMARVSHFSSDKWDGELGLG